MKRLRKKTNVFSSQFPYWTTTFASEGGSSSWANPGQYPALQKILGRFRGSKIKVAYEAGPCGFGLHDQLKEDGVEGLGSGLIEIAGPGKSSLFKRHFSPCLSVKSRVFFDQIISIFSWLTNNLPFGLLE